MAAKLKHGASGNSKTQVRAPEYSIWIGIKARCFNPKATAYHRYGGRGITVCELWKNSFSDFLAHVGPRPSAQHSIDRYPDRDGNYQPGNVRWATKREQALNSDPKPRKLNGTFQPTGKTTP